MDTRAKWLGCLHCILSQLKSLLLLWALLKVGSFLGHPVNRLGSIPICGINCFQNLNSPVCVCTQSLQLCLTLCDPMDCSQPDSLSMEFSRQEYWSGLPCPSPRGLPDPGIEPVSPAASTLQIDSLPLGHQGSPSTVLLKVDEFICEDIYLSCQGLLNSKNVLRCQTPVFVEVCVLQHTQQTSKFFCPDSMISSMCMKSYEMANALGTN